MAGARVEIQFDSREVQEALGNAAALLGDPAPLLQDIGDSLVNSTRDRFRLERGPDGTLWKALSPRYLAVKEPNPGKILHRRGELLRQIFAQLDGGSVLVGTNLVYGATHQFGARKGSFGTTRRAGPLPWGDIPARPFLGVSDADGAEILEIVRDHLLQAISSGPAK